MSDEANRAVDAVAERLMQTLERFDDLLSPEAARWALLLMPTTDETLVDKLVHSEAVAGRPNLGRLLRLATIGALVERTRGNQIRPTEADVVA